ncbi:peptidase U32 [Anaerocolumna cellulosilytica]|uniref:Peptidase U32 n=1 Tax=Anaerocolumna cellulosilytica TaxID=433286 RepID=A0A6S6QW36_9FIRM|nr:U32 family peptidase [Anaerocolumna cellulosilytica]MBB5197425.1 putative protease [Anaerocolumna cellulosilytica]BCJ95443.1 peptidase U32 [Anaerocolumna cellulosilytica]
MKNIEILAPAGSITSLKAAIHAGCDAVYIGGSKFGARAYADNFGQEELCQAIDYVHVHGKKVYLTINTLLKNKEIEKELYSYLHPYYEQGVDAVIVQDSGVLLFVHEHFPDFPIHASTQMSLTMGCGGDVLKSLGVTRLVNARELGLEEIKALRSSTDLEVESFVHGALCYCYSGQCLLSSMIGGRSGNRGRCAQPCRMPYQLYNGKQAVMDKEDKYLLSPKDICTLDRIPELMEAGIDSFKIEGRMKRPEYAAGVAYAYRKYADKYLELGKENYQKFLSKHEEEFKNDKRMLLDLYSRGGFTGGYYEHRNGKAMMSLTRPNHSGVYVGKVEKVRGNQAIIRLEEDIQAQDILEIRNRQDDVYDFTVKAGEVKGKDYTTNFKSGLKISTGFSVYRTKNNMLLDHLADRFLKEERKEPITGELTAIVSKPLQLALTCRDITVMVRGELVEEAKNQPMTKEKLEKQVNKTNDTSFFFKELSITQEGNTFIPVQRLNELRRQGLQLLYDAIKESYRRELKENIENPVAPYYQDTTVPGISVSVIKEDQLKAACKNPEVENVYLESDIVSFSKLLSLTAYVKEKGKKCYLLLPHIFRKATYELFRQNKTILEDNTIDGYIIRNYEEYYFITKELEFDKKQLVTDYNLYVMNTWNVRFWRKKGIKCHTAPLELNNEELLEMNGYYWDLLVYGRMPLMVSAQCLAKTAQGSINQNYTKVTEAPCCGPDMEELNLTDRFQKSFPIKRHCRDCYNLIYNSQRLSLLSNREEVIKISPKNIRLDFTYETGDETEKILHKFINTYHKKSLKVEEIKDFTRGHFKRGIE